MNIISTFFIGLLFGLGLIISGMVNPAKVQNFLDLAGSWDPSLAFVMGGAIAIALPGYRWVRGRSQPLLSDKFQWPTSTSLDAKLIGGAALFGIGWGLGGLCPGPALTVFSSGAMPILLFVIAMIAGIIAAGMLSRR